MKFLNQLTLSNLKNNKGRTLMTIFAVILSVALFYTIITMGMIFKDFVIDVVKHDEGNYHVVVKDPQKYENIIENNIDIKSHYKLNTLGFHERDIDQEYDKYIKVNSGDKNFFESKDIEILEGKYPENSSEIVLDQFLYKSYGSKIGEDITLDLDRNKNLEKEYNENENVDENLTIKKNEDEKNILTKTYKVVGVVRISNSRLYNYGTSLISFTLSDQNEEIVDSRIFYELKDISKLGNHLESVYGIKSKEIKKVFEENENVGLNTRLVKTQTNNFGSEIDSLLSGIVVLLVTVVAITSIMIIRNSISISVVSRTKEYGILKSIGATNRQIRNNILFEGIIISSFGILFGILLGIAATRILSLLIMTLIGESFKGLEIRWYISIISIIVCVFLGLMTVLISTYMIAQRAIMISPISAIKGSKDVKISKKEVSTPKFIEKIFGIAGLLAYKNIKRNKKSYRTTVIALSLSLAIFIGISTIIVNLTKAVSFRISYTNHNIKVRNLSENPEQNKKEIFDLVNNVLNENDEYTINYIKQARVNTKEYDRKFLDVLGIEKEDQHFLDFIDVVLLENSSYKKFIKQFGIDNVNVLVYNKAKSKIDGKIVETNVFNDMKIRLAFLDYYDDRNVTEKDFDQLVAVEKENFEKEAKEYKLKEIEKLPIGVIESNRPIILMNLDIYDKNDIKELYLDINSKNPNETEKNINEYISNNNIGSIQVYNISREINLQNNMILLMQIFGYGFIIIIALIGITNVVNAISNNVIVRKREYAALSSMGMNNKQLNKMKLYETIFLTFRAIIYGLISGALISFIAYTIISKNLEFKFQLPVFSTLIFISTIGILIYIIMTASVNKILKGSIIETLKNEGI